MEPVAPHHHHLARVCGRRRARLRPWWCGGTGRSSPNAPRRRRGHRGRRPEVRSADRGRGSAEAGSAGVGSGRETVDHSAVDRGCASVARQDDRRGGGRRGAPRPGRQAPPFGPGEVAEETGGSRGGVLAATAQARRGAGGPRGTSATAFGPAAARGATGAVAPQQVAQGRLPQGRGGRLVGTGAVAGHRGGRAHGGVARQADAR